MTRVRVRLPNIRAWATSERATKGLLIGTCALAVVTMILHGVAAVRMPDHRLTEISCAVSWACVGFWARVSWRYSQMFFEVRDVLDRRINGGSGTFTSG